MEKSEKQVDPLAKLKKELFQLRLQAMVLKDGSCDALIGAKIVEIKRNLAEHYREVNNDQHQK